MAITGLSKPIVADYAFEGGKVKYTKLTAASKAVEYSIEVEAADDNDFYADNMIAETATGQFSSGTLTLTTADFTPELSLSILGAKTVSRQVGEKPTDEIVFDDDLKPTTKGFGIIEEHQIDNKRGYLPIVLPKVTFNINSRSATTRGDAIDWQTPEITARILRSDQSDEQYKHPWQISPKEMYETEAEAEEYIKAVLNDGMGK